MALFREIRPLNAIAVKLTSADTPHPHMPDVACPVMHRIQLNDFARRRVVRILIELQANTG
jgi:hypothetical protein